MCFTDLPCRCPELTFLSMAGAANTRMPNLDEAPALAMLDLSRCSKLAEASTRATLMRLTSLRELSVSGISHFLDQTVQHVSGSGAGLAGMLPEQCGLLCRPVGVAVASREVVMLCTCFVAPCFAGHLC